MKSFSRLTINTIIASPVVPKKLRNKLLNFFGMKVDSSCRIMSNFFLDSKNITIMENSFINRFFQFHDGGRDEELIIESNVMIAMNVKVIAVSHEIGSSDRRAGKTFSKPIIFRKGCWIGADVTVLPGVTIGEGCVIAAGSVVTNDCEPNCLYGGVPAKRIKELDKH